MKTDKIKQDLQKMADDLFSKRDYKKLFATNDGYFFTDPENVKEHARQIGSEFYTFTRVDANPAKTVSEENSETAPEINSEEKPEVDSESASEPEQNDHAEPAAQTEPEDPNASANQTEPAPNKSAASKKTKTKK